VVYCLALLELVKRRYNRATMWDQLAAAVEQGKPAAAAGEVKRRRPAPARGGASFVSGW